MSKSVSTSTDKIIVDRSKKHRNKAVFDTVKTTRERLQQGAGGNEAYEREMLTMHIAEALQGAMIMPLFIVLASIIGLYITGDISLIIWSLIALSFHAMSLVLAKRAAKQEITDENLQHWKNLFLAMQILIGCAWALFALAEPVRNDPTLVLFFKGATLLIALSLTAMANFMLRRATFMTFLPVLAALCITSAISRDPFDVGLALMFGMAILFCHRITTRLYQTSIKLLSSQTEKDDLIAELEVANSVSDEARRRAEEANLAKSRFLASMSHKLRTPLNAILGFSEVMSSEVLGPLNNPLYKEYSGDIHRSGQHLLDLINEILDLSRIEAGRYDLNEESIRQVILNLLSNAVKFTPQGGEILVKAGWTAGGGQYVSIRDNGPGIPEDEIPVVLSAFGQGSIAIKSAEQGTGLGLPIVQAILAKHDGQFILKSKLREGTEGIAILPAKRVLQSLPAVEETHAIQPRRRSFA